MKDSRMDAQYELLTIINIHKLYSLIQSISTFANAPLYAIATEAHILLVIISTKQHSFKATLEGR